MDLVLPPLLGNASRAIGRAHGLLAWTILVTGWSDSHTNRASLNASMYHYLVLMVMLSSDFIKSLFIRVSAKSGQSH